MTSTSDRKIKRKHTYIHSQDTVLEQVEFIQIKMTKSGNFGKFTIFHDLPKFIKSTSSIRFKADKILHTLKEISKNFE